jgi:hypothetical protein
VSGLCSVSTNHAVAILCVCVCVCVCGLERLRPYIILSKDLSYVRNAKSQEDCWGP